MENYWEMLWTCFNNRVQVSTSITEVSWGLLCLKIRVYCNELDGEAAEMEVSSWFKFQSLVTTSPLLLPLQRRPKIQLRVHCGIQKTQCRLIIVVVVVKDNVNSWHTGKTERLCVVRNFFCLSIQLIWGIAQLILAWLWSWPQIRNKSNKAKYVFLYTGKLYQVPKGKNLKDVKCESKQDFEESSLPFSSRTITVVLKLWTEWLYNFSSICTFTVLSHRVLRQRLWQWCSEVENLVGLLKVI